MNVYTWRDWNFPHIWANTVNAQHNILSSEAFLEGREIMRSLMLSPEATGTISSRVFKKTDPILPRFQEGGDHGRT
jgi:hypothetical protein